MAFNVNNFAVNELTSLFFSINRNNSIGSDGTKFVQFDAYIEEKATYSTKVTTSPIENGSIIHDHTIRQPTILNIEAVATNTPIQFFGGLNNILDLAGNLTDFSSDAQLADSNSRRQFEALIELFRSVKLVDITTTLKVYNNMLLTGFVQSSNIKTSKDLHISMQFTEVMIVDNTSDKNKVGEDDGLTDMMSDISLGSRTIGEATSEAVSAVKRILSNIGL